jgi:uncharacterized protein (TIGR00255 family)
MKNIYSMTAFAKKSQQGEWGQITWEVRSVNHRYLDLSLRLPEVFRYLEPELRNLAQQHVKRGKVECFLQYHSENNDPVRFNPSAFGQLINMVEQVENYFPGRLAPLNPIQLLNWEGVLQANNQENSLVGNHILLLFAETIGVLNQVRKREGEALYDILQDRLTQIVTEVDKVQHILPSVVDAYRAKTMNFCSENEVKIDENRLEQEVVLFVHKMDIAEEVDRLITHVHEAAKVLERGGQVGKQLDFLMQELNREANTLASKSVTKETTYIALSIKVLVEQIREQIQNLE